MGQVIPSIALVLGGGGTIAQAFHAGLLAVLADETGWDARDADVIVGTSAGASTAALVRAGLTGRDLVRRATGEPAGDRLAEILQTLGPPLDIAALRAGRSRRPARPPGSPATIARAARRPWLTRPGAVAAAFAPAGRVPSALIAEPMDRLYATGWPDRPLRLCTVRTSDGHRVVFDGPPATVGQAVAASCAVPGFYSPTTIAGHHYVDGGAWSATNADVVAADRCDLVIVSSPMSGPGTGVRADTVMRAFLRAQVRREVARLRRRGHTVVLAEPVAADVQVMGGDVLDPARRIPATRQVLASMAERIRAGDLGRQLAAAGLPSRSV